MSATDPTSRPAGTFRTGGVIALSACHFIHDVYSSFLAPLLPLIIDKLSLSLTQAGFLTTVMQIPSLANPFIGSLADRVSVRYFVILAPATTAIPMSFIGVAPSYGVLLLLLLVTGISVALFHVPAPTMVARLSGDRMGRGMSFYMTGGELARAVGPVIAVGAVSLMGLEGFYPVMTVGILASVWLFFRFHDPSHRISIARRRSLAQTVTAVRPVMLPLVGILFARGFMHAAMTAFLPTFIRQETGNLWLAGAGLTLMEAAGVAGVLAAGHFSDRWGRRRVLSIALMGAPVGLLLFVLIGGPGRYLMLILTGFTLLSTTPVMLALVQEHAPESPSAANGLFMMASFMARSAVVVLVGMLGDAIGLRSTYLICALIGTLGIPLIRVIPARPPTQA